MMQAERAPIFAIVPSPLWVVMFVGIASAIAASGLDMRIDALYHPLLGNFISALAIIPAGWAILTFFIEKTQIAPASRINNKLVAHGPYRFTRNPMYLAMLLLPLGLSLRIGHAAFFVVPVLSYLINDRIVIPYEERKMEAQFGEAYLAYKAKVRRWI